MPSLTRSPRRTDAPLPLSRIAPDHRESGWYPARVVSPGRFQRVPPESTTRAGRPTGGSWPSRRAGPASRVCGSPPIPARRSDAWWTGTPTPMSTPGRRTAPGSHCIPPGMPGTTTSGSCRWTGARRRASLQACSPTCRSGARTAAPSSSPPDSPGVGHRPSAFRPRGASRRGWGQSRSSRGTGCPRMANIWPTDLSVAGGRSSK